MKLILDTVNSGLIEKLYTMTGIGGVTSNPTILSKEALPGDTSEETIRRALGTVRRFDPDGEFHIQVLSTEWMDIVEEAHAITELFGRDVFIKIPVTTEGLKAIRHLKREGIRVTATAIYSFTQAFLALNAGADYAALYCNRMAANGVDFRLVIEQLKEIIPEGRILAASFKSIEQVIDAYTAGADSCTVPPGLLLDALDSPVVLAAVDRFSSDWKERFGK